MKSQPSDPFKSPEKSSAAMKPQPSDQISSRTPKKLPNLPQRIKYHRHSLPLPEKYEMLLRFFDALDASLKLLRFRKTIPLFKKIRVMVETMSERRFTHRHLAQLKFLLPEIKIKRVLMADEETRCMKYDLHITMSLAERRKKGSKHSCLRDRIISQLLEFARDHPEESEIPEEELPEPFNQQKFGLLSKTFKQSSSCSSMCKYSGVDVEPETAQASHFPPSFRKHFSRGGAVSESRNSLHNRSVSMHQSPSISVLNSSLDRDLFGYIETTASPPEMAPYKLSAGQSKLKPLEDGEAAGQIKCKSIVDDIAAGQIKRNALVDDETCCAQTAKRKQGTPIKSAGTPFKPVTPSVQPPKKFRSTVDVGSVSSECQMSNRPSCARSLQFGSTSKSVNVELQIEDDDIVDILPENLLQSLKEKEKKVVEMVKRKQVIKNLPKLFDRIYILFQNTKYSAIRKEALIRDLTECHSEITDENEVEEQFKLLQEKIPEWISCKLSPSGNILYSINKALNPNMLRLTLSKAT